MQLVDEGQAYAPVLLFSLLALPLSSGLIESLLELTMWCAPIYELKNPFFFFTNSLLQGDVCVIASALIGQQYINSLTVIF